MNNPVVLISVIIGVVMIVGVMIVGSKGAKKKKEEEERKIQERKAAFERLAKLKPRIGNYDEILPQLQKLDTGALLRQTAQYEHTFKLIDKYGVEDGQRLGEHKYWIGMTEEMVIDAKGQPTKIETEVMKTKTKKLLIYGNKSSGDVFTVVNGTVERFKDN